MNKTLEVLKNTLPGTDFPLDLSDFKKPLRSYQKVAAAFAYYSRTCILGDPTGTGKTVMSLAACALIDKKKSINHVLILSPYSLRQWQEEIDTFLGWDSIIVRSVPKKKRRFLWKETRDNFFTITNYHMLINDWEIVSHFDWDVVIYDEASCFKNGDTVRFAHVSALSRHIASKGGFVMGLSATPMEGKFEDLWGVMSGVGVQMGTFEFYTKRYCKTERKSIWLWRSFPRLVHSGGRRTCPKCGSTVGHPFKQCPHPRCDAKFKWEKKLDVIVGCSDLPGLQDLLYDYYIMRTKTSLLPELPKIVPEFVKLALSSGQKKALKELESLDINSAVRLLFEREISNSVKVYKKDEKKHDSPKLDWLTDALEGFLHGQKVVYFSQFKEMIRGACAIFDKLGVKYVVVTGDFDKEQQELEVDKFQKDESIKALIGTVAIEKSWNLQVAGIMVCFDMIMNPARMAQLYGRIERIGSEHSSIVVYNLIMEKSVDEEMLEIIGRKLGNVQDVFGFTNMTLNLDFDVESELKKRR